MLASGGLRASGGRLYVVCVCVCGRGGGGGGGEAVQALCRRRAACERVGRKAARGAAGRRGSPQLRPTDIDTVRASAGGVRSSRRATDTVTRAPLAERGKAVLGAAGGGRLG